jgi:hypothetical protein
MSDAFAKTTFGPPAPTGLDTNKHSLIADVKSGIVEMVDDAGVSHGIQTSLLVLLAQTALSNITTAQNLISQALNAGALNKLKRTIQVSGWVIYTSPGTTGITLTIALKLGATTLCTITLPIGNTAARTNAPIQFQFVLEVAATGSAGTIESHGSIMADLNAAAGASITNILDANVAVSSAIDLTAAQTLAVTIACAGVTLTSAQLRMAQIEVVN